MTLPFIPRAAMMKKKLSSPLALAFDVVGSLKKYDTGPF